MARARQQCDVAYQRYGACYDYAGASVHTSNLGGTVSFPVERPTLAWNGYHTLMEMAVFNRTPAGIDEDTAEIGWIITPSKPGKPPVPHLFIYHFVNTEGTCYNDCGFVSTSQKIKPGMALRPGTDVTWTVREIRGNWTFFFDGIKFGYIPESAYKGTFNRASDVEVYGEIAGAGVRPGCSQMGTGLFGTQSGAAKVGGFSLFGASATPRLVPYYPTDPAAWNSATPAQLQRLGGPGGCKPMAGTVSTGNGGYTVVGTNTAAYPFPLGSNPWARPPSPPPPQVAGAGQIVAVAGDPATGGYWMADDQGDVYPVNAPDYGGMNGVHLPAPIVGITAFKSGYLLVDAKGDVYNFNAPKYGTSVTPAAPIVGITAFKSGYLLVDAKGDVYNFNAPKYSRSVTPAAPIVGITAFKSGYLLVDAKGDVYNLHAPNLGSLRRQIAKPIIGITSTPGGYLLTDAFGGVYAFGTPFNGSVTREGI